MKYIYQIARSVNREQKSSNTHKKQEQEQPIKTGDHYSFRIVINLHTKIGDPVIFFFTCRYSLLLVQLILNFVLFSYFSFENEFQHKTYKH